MASPARLVPSKRPISMAELESRGLSINGKIVYTIHHGTSKADQPAASAEPEYASTSRSWLSSSSDDASAASSAALRYKRDLMDLESSLARMKAEVAVVEEKIEMIMETISRLIPSQSSMDSSVSAESEESLISRLTNSFSSVDSSRKFNVSTESQARQMKEMLSLSDIQLASSPILADYRRQIQHLIQIETGKDNETAEVANSYIQGSIIVVDGRDWDDLDEGLQLAGAYCAVIKFHIGPKYRGLVQYHSIGQAYRAMKKGLKGLYGFLEMRWPKIDEYGSRPTGNYISIRNVPPLVLSNEALIASLAKSLGGYLPSVDKGLLHVDFRDDKSTSLGKRLAHGLAVQGSIMSVV